MDILGSKYNVTFINPVARSVTSSVLPVKNSDNSSLSVTTPIEDYLPQSRAHDDEKKEFKTTKDWAAYLLILLDKIDKITPPEGRKFLTPENRAQFEKLEQELMNISASNISLS